MLSSILNLQTIGARVTMMGDINDPVYTYINPSIAFDGKGKLRIVIRSCNFAVEPEGKFYYREGTYSKSKVLYGYIDPITLEVSGLQELKYCKDTPFHIVNSGLEDARLYWREDGMHFIGAEVDRRPQHNYPAQQAEFVYDEQAKELKYLRTMFGESPARAEKNWMPPDVPSKLFEYNYSPTQVIQQGKLSGVRYDGWIHGSSQLLWQPKSKTYIAMLHSKHANPMIVEKVYDHMIYVHYFAEYNEQGFLQQITAPFTFGLQDNIEFVAGMVEHQGKLIVSLGAGDGRWGIVSIDKNILIKLLKPYGGIEVSPLPSPDRELQRYLDRKLYLSRKARR